MTPKTKSAIAGILGLTSILSAVILVATFVSLPQSEYVKVSEVPLGVETTVRSGPYSGCGFVPYHIDYTRPHDTLYCGSLVCVFDQFGRVHFENCVPSSVRVER